MVLITPFKIVPSALVHFTVWSVPGYAGPIRYCLIWLTDKVASWQGVNVAPLQSGKMASYQGVKMAARQGVRVAPRHGVKMAPRQGGKAASRQGVMTSAGKLKRPHVKRPRGKAIS